jgi:hypothetical protein
MMTHDLERVDFLGSPPGMWALHPPYRSALFYETLPSLIRRIEIGDVPEAQRGRYDIEDCLVDWTSAARRHRWRRWSAHLGVIASRIVSRNAG